MKVINGDITNINKGVIIHQVNNKHVMGAGVAKSIRTKHPTHYTDYMNSTLTLGSLVCSRINPNFGIIGMVAQNGYGRNKDTVYTDYSAFRKCLIAIKELYNKNPNINYYMPYNIGCGLANGNWDTIESLIRELCPFIILVKYSPTLQPIGELPF